MSAVLTSTGVSSTHSHHPHDPMSGAEIEVAVATYLASKEAEEAGKCSFSYAKVLDPPKSAVRAWQSNGISVPRVLRLVGIDQSGGGGFQADVDVGSKLLVKVVRIPSDGQAPLTLKDLITASQLVKSEPAWIEAIKKRGLKPDQVEVEPWPPGAGIFDKKFPQGARIWRCLFFLKIDKTDNCYGRPIHGLQCDVDVNSKKVHLVDHGPQAFPSALLAHAGARFDTASQGPLRDDLKRIEIQQPEGVSFQVNGHHVKWAGWEFRVSMHPVHGLVLHDVSLHGRGLLYRASLSDMVVPYSDKDPQHSFKHVFDGSEPTITGVNTNSLKLGCDCLGEIFYFDMDYLGWDGEPKMVEQAICLHEEDAGIQWKTTDMRTQISEVRRARRLVVSSFSTVGNYDYGWYYHFHLDGELEIEVKLTGIMSVGGAETADPQFSPLVTPDIAAPLHQHLFCFRLDWDLDGGPNSLYEDQVELIPQGSENPMGSTFRHISRLLQTENEAKRTAAPDVNRIWKIVNHKKKNAVGKPVAYKVLPGASPTLLAHDNSAVAKRCVWARHNLWATQFVDDELHAAGEHTVMSEGGAGLPAYTQGNRSIVDCNLVTWHTIGVTHVPRPEDWPVMPVEKARLHLLPTGFFDKNPTMNLAPGNAGSSCHAQAPSKL